MFYSNWFRGAINFVKCILYYNMEKTDDLLKLSHKTNKQMQPTVR